eukprot:scaffold303267_cov31-Tisochrysis_lutea.AAC.1
MYKSLARPSISVKRGGFPYQRRAELGRRQSAPSLLSRTLSLLSLSLPLAVSLPLPSSLSSPPLPSPLRSSPPSHSFSSRDLIVLPSLPTLLPRHRCPSPPRA